MATVVVAVSRSATATAAVTCSNVVLGADWVAIPTVAAESAVLAAAMSEVAAALPAGCKFVVLACSISVDVGKACFARRSFVVDFDPASRIRVAPRAAAFRGFWPAIILGELRWGWPGIGVI
jgi:hypothetical protein